MNRSGSKMRFSLEELVEAISELSLPERLRTDGFDDTRRLRWRGSLVAETCRPGFHIFIVNLWGSADVEISTEFTETGVGFGLALEGSSHQTVPGTAERVSALEIKAGKNLAAVCRPGESNLYLPGGQWHRIVKLQIDSQQIPALLDGQERQIPEFLRPVILPSKPWRASVQTPLSPALECIGYQIVNCPFKGAARRLFLEAKALEILAEELGDAAEIASEEKRWYSYEERESLDLARTILEREYSDPPTILALSRRVGLNDFKLKRGFRDLYSTTIFGYVRKLRMEKARALLESGACNVTEAALETGHTSLGHFAAAFKKAFGVVPSRYRAGSGFRNISS